MMNSNVYCNSDDAFWYEGKPPRQVPEKAQLGLEATYRLYECAEGWVFLAALFDADFALFCKAVGREDLLADERFKSWKERYANKEALGALLEPLFRTKSAEAWESELTKADVGCVRADRSGHVRFLHEDAHPKAIGFMVETRSPEFLKDAPEGRYWRHAPAVKFSDTPCVFGLPYEGPGTHTREVFRGLGYDDATIDRLSREGVINVAEAKLQPA